MSRISFSSFSFSIAALSLSLIPLTACRRQMLSGSPSPKSMTLQPPAAALISGSNPEDPEATKMQQREAAITLHLQ